MQRLVRLTAAKAFDGRSLVGIHGTVALLVADDQIVAFGPDARVPRPPQALELQFPDGTMLPGLVDPHIHLTFSGSPDPLDDLLAASEDELIERAGANAARMLAGGVTTAVDLGARMGTVEKAIRRLVVAGVPAPRVLRSGPPLTPTGGHLRFLGGEVDGIRGVRKQVRALVDSGVDVVKVMSTGGTMTHGTSPARVSYPQRILTAIADEAHRHGRWVTGHAHSVTGIRSSARAGFDAVEHATMLGRSGRWRFDSRVAHELAERGTRAVVTLSHGSFPERVTNVRNLRDCGVQVILGTDVGVRNTDFGSQLIRELETHVANGSSPTRMLESATADAAAHIGLGSILGRLATGYAADVVIADGRPDLDVSRLHALRFVMVGGDVVMG